MKLLVTMLFICTPLFCLNASAQEKEDFSNGAIKMEYGYLLVWNTPGNYYTLRIDGDDVRQISTEQIHFSVDGVFLQVVTPKIKSFLKDPEKLDAKAILAAHQDWETNYMEGEYKEKLRIESFPQKLANGEVALLWQFEVPKSAGGNVKKQSYLTLVKGEHIFMLGSVVTDTISERASHRLLLLTALGLRPSDKPTDLGKIQALVKDM